MKILAGTTDRDIQLIKAGTCTLALAGISTYGGGTQVSGGVLRGYKDTQAILYITLFCYWVIGMPMGYTLAMTDLIMPHLGAKGFWIGFVVSLTAAALLLVYRMHKIQAQTDDVLLTKLENLK